MIKRNPEKIREDLTHVFSNASFNPKSENLEKVLWLLYNPTGLCEECGLSWDSLSCTCKGCEYRDLDIINEPCDNHHFCVCDYFDGEGTKNERGEFIQKLYEEELTDREKLYVRANEPGPNSDDNIENISDIIYAFSRSTNENHYNINKELEQFKSSFRDDMIYEDGFNFDKFDDNFDILENIKIDILYTQDDKIKITEQLFKFIDNYLSYLKIRKTIRRIILNNFDRINIIIDDSNRKYLKYLVKKFNKYVLFEDSKKVLKDLEDKLK